MDTVHNKKERDSIHNEFVVPLRQG